MHVPNLFEIDPDRLFEVHNIEEIQLTQSKLQNEIERKREELRTMVGERYRDLIEAADKIAEMKEISQNIIRDIEGVSAATDQLQKKNVKNFGWLVKQKDSNISQAAAPRPSLDYVLMHLKLLSGLPEHIWTSLDETDYATATQLYLFGRHIKTGLEMDSIIRSNSYTGNTFNCPILERQSVALAHFKDHILESVAGALQQQAIEAQSVCGCFISVALLENKSAKDLIQYFLSLRLKALQNTINFGLESAEDAAAIKSRFKNSHTIVISTLLTLYSCFIEFPGETGDGLLWRRIRKVIGRDSTPVMNILINKEQSENSNFVEDYFPYHMLPAIISNYRCCPESTLEPLPPTELSAIVNEWLTKITEFIKESGKSLLNKLSSLRSLQGLKGSNQELPEEWSLVLQRLMLPTSTNIWRDVYVPLITDRAKQLITIHWQAGLKHIKEQISEVIKESASIQGCKTPENDLHWYVWKESSGDLVSTGDKSNNNSQQPLPSASGIWLKAQGVTPRVAELCNSFETQLSSLRNDLSTLFPNDDVPIVDDGSKSLQMHQRTQCLSVLTQLVKFVKSEVESSTGDVVPLLLARFIQTITKLCPTLHKCLIDTDLKINAWQESCDILNVEISFCWTVWRTRMLAALDESITSTLLQPKQLKDLLHMIPQWDLIHIEEVGEAGQTLSSELRVPSSPSFQLLSVLSSVCASVSYAFIPVCITELLVNDLVVKILKIYESMVTAEGAVVSPSQLWQQLFDIKFLMSSLVQHDNKQLVSQCQEVIGVLERKIDPFDLDVFTPYINESIKKSHRQVQSMLGTLVVSRVMAPVSSITNAAGGTQSRSINEDPSMLAISASASATWFPLLPVTAPSGTRVINPTKLKVGRIGGSTEQHSVQDVQHSTSVKATSAMASTASSFFGSMTSDWFG